MREIVKKITFILLLLFTGQLYAYQYNSGSTFVFGSVLDWTVREGTADNWAQVFTPKGRTQTATLIDAPFHWNTGFRVGLGYNGQDDWDTAIYYTSYHTQATSQASGIVTSAFLGNFYVNNTLGNNFGPTYGNASVRWNVAFNTLDVEAGRKFKVDSILTLRPFVGLKAALINQSIYSTWLNPTVPTTFTAAEENLKNNFLGVGPAIGLDTTWPIYTTNKNTLALMGDFSGALMWGHWTFSDLYQNNTPATDTISVGNVNGAATMVRAFIGLQWTAVFPSGDLNVNAGYEEQVWFNQLQYYSFNMGRLNHLMSIQGGVLGLSYHF